MKFKNDFSSSHDWGSGSGYTAADRLSKYSQPYPPQAPQSFSDFTEVALQRVKSNLSDPWSYARQYGFSLAGDTAGYGARIVLRSLFGVNGNLALFASQVLADEFFTALLTKESRRADSGFSAWAYEVIEGLSARTALQMGFHLFCSIPGGGIGGLALKFLVSGALLAAGGMLGERLNRVLGSKIAVTPGGIYGFGLRMVDAQTTLLKGQATKKGLGLINIQTPENNKIRLDSDEIGQYLEAKLQIPPTRANLLSLDHSSLSKKPEEVLSQWIRAVNKHDLEQLLALYHESAVLTPTFSNRTLNDSKKIRDYFITLSQREKLQIKLHQPVTVQPLREGVYNLSGMYRWRFKVEGKVLHFEARFTYVLDLNQAKPILHHHSSQVPRLL